MSLPNTADAYGGPYLRELETCLLALNFLLLSLSAISVLNCSQKDTQLLTTDFHISLSDVRQCCALDLALLPSLFSYDIVSFLCLQVRFPPSTTLHDAAEKVAAHREVKVLLMSVGVLNDHRSAPLN